MKMGIERQGQYLFLGQYLGDKRVWQGMFGAARGDGSYVVQRLIGRASLDFLGRKIGVRLKIELDWFHLGRRHMRSPITFSLEGTMRKGRSVIVQSHHWMTQKQSMDAV